MDELLNERRQSFKVVIEMKHQDPILMNNEGILSHRGNLMNLINVIDEEQMRENINADDETRMVLEEGSQRDIKEKCIEEEGHILKDVKKEEVYETDLAKGERTSDDLLITKEGMENCVKLPNFTPIEIIELYGKFLSKKGVGKAEDIYSG